MPTVEQRAAIGDVNVFWHEAPAATAAPTLYLHGVPTDSDDWLPFLERTGGVAPDLPGFGRSDKPSHFDYSIAGYVRFLHAFLEAAGIDRFSLVAHDWGVVGLVLAQTAPERVERLVVVNAVPLLDGYRWHRFARVWRTPLAGEVMMGYTFKWVLRRSAAFTVDRRATPPALVDRVYRRFDHGTQRAILKLYRSAPPAALAAAGERLGALEAPALVVWGARDPYIPTRFGELYAARLADARLEVLPDAGHWPWLDRPQALDLVTEFLARPTP